MIRLLARITLQILASAVGLLIASALLDGFQITSIGFVVSVFVFVVAGFILEPLLFKLSLQYLPALRGGIALVTTLASLIITTIFTEGLSITGLQTWILAPLIVWLCVLLASVILPLFLFKKTLQAAKDNNNQGGTQ